MEYSDREILILSRKLIVELKNLAVIISRIENHSSSIAQQAKSDYESHKTPPILRAELQVPQSVVKDWAGENRKGKPLDKWALSVNVGTLVVVAVYATINFFMLCAMRKADTTTGDQLAAFKRVEGASLGVGQPVGDISLGEVRVPIVNYARVPSPRAWIWPHVIRFAKGKRPSYVKDYSFGGDDTPIPPGIAYGVRLPMEFKEGEIDKLKDGTETLWVAVSIKYDDGFGEITPTGGPCWEWNRFHPEIWDACPSFSFAHLPK